MKKLSLLLIFSILLNYLNAQTVFEKTYGNAEYDFGTSIQELPEGGYMIAGVIGDETGSYYYLIKTDAFGDTIWMKKYDSYEFTEINKIPMILTDDNAIIFIQHNEPQSDIWNMVVTKVDLDGEIIWEKEYGTDEDSYISFAIISSNEGSCVIPHRKNDVTNLIKLDAEGNELINVSLDDIWVITDAFQEDDGYVLGGLSFGDTYKYVIAKTNLDGDLVWEKEYLGLIYNESVILSSISQSNDNGYMMYTTYLSPDFDYFGYILKFNHLGDTIWTKKYASPAFYYNLTDGLQVSEDGYFVTGLKSSIITEINNAVLINIDEEGNIIWEKEYNIGQHSVGIGLQKTSDNGFAIIGFQEYEDDDADIYFVKTDNYGNALSINNSINVNSNYIYPNPSQGRINYSGENFINITVLNLEGEELLTITEKEFDISFLPKGIYLIKVTSENNTVVTKIIKQ